MKSVKGKDECPSETRWLTWNALNSKSAIFHTQMVDLHALLSLQQNFSRSEAGSRSSTAQQTAQAASAAATATAEATAGTHSLHNALATDQAPQQQAGGVS
jgi:hypothetical protein